MNNNEIKLTAVEMPNQKADTKEKYYISREGLKTSLYQIEDEDIAQKYYGIKVNEISFLDDEQLSEIADQAYNAGKRCCICNLGSLGDIVVGEKRLGNNIRNLVIDTKIENVLKKFSKMTDEERVRLAKETKVGNYEAYSIYSAIKEYAEKKKISTVTVRSVFLFTNAVDDCIETINLLKSLRRVGIHIYFKNDGLWTGNLMHDMDIGALAVLARCESIKEDNVEEIKTTNTLF